MTPQFLKYVELDSLIQKQPGLIVEDYIELALDELFDIVYPAKKDNKTAAETAEYANQLTGGDAKAWGEWVFYTWLNKVVHMPPRTELRALRTSRNRNLITAAEQLKLYEATILIAGMSVGSNIVEALVSQGIGNTFILADMDIIEPSNLNRIRSPYHHVGLHKVEAVARKVWEIDPYIEIVAYRDGLNQKNLLEILEKYRLTVIVDEVDDLGVKILIREQAKARRLPVVMAADDGDDALIDIERYDLDENLELFDGRVPADVLERIKAGGIARAELGMMIGRYFVGAENIPLRMYQSLTEVGKSLPSWPQLGGAAALSGIALAYAIKKIVLGQGLRAGRTLVSVDQKLGLDQLDPEHKRQLEEFQRFMKAE